MPWRLRFEKRSGLKQTMQSKYYIQRRRIIQLFRRRSGWLLGGFVLFAVIFAAMAIVHNWFVYRQLDQSIRQELAAWAKEIDNEIAYKDRWDLAGYWQAYISAPRWYVISNSGLILDIEGLIPGVFGPIEPVDDAIFTAPKTIATEIGETKRMYGRRIDGGYVIVSMDSSDDTSDADSELVANAANFGTSLASAVATKSRLIDNDVSYAIIGSDQEIKNAFGAIPLKTSILPKPLDQMAKLESAKTVYQLYFQPITDSSGKTVGTIIVPKDVGLS